MAHFAGEATLFLLIMEDFQNEEPRNKIILILMLRSWSLMIVCENIHLWLLWETGVTLSNILFETDIKGHFKSLYLSKWNCR